MDRPALTGIPEYRPLPRWRLGLALVWLLGSAACYAFLLTKDPLVIPWQGGFVFLHAAVPVLLALAGCAWAILRARRHQEARRSAFWGVLGLSLLPCLGMILWWKMEDTRRNLDGY
jgi:hypothetical protein